MNTSIIQKSELWPRFVNACESQWMGGGERYMLSENKEFTDLICEAVGNHWIGGNIIKYVGELINTDPKPEVDFFKIAVWAFIWWLKEQENITQIDEGEKFNNGKADTNSTRPSRSANLMAATAMVQQTCSGGQATEANSGDK